MKRSNNFRRTAAIVSALVIASAIAVRPWPALHAASIDTIDYLLTLVAPIVSVPCATPDQPQAVCETPDGEGDRRPLGQRRLHTHRLQQQRGGRREGRWPH